MDDRLVVTARVEHKDMATADMDKGLRDTRPHLWITAQVALDRLDRALDIVLQDRDAIRDGGFDQFLRQPGFQQSTYHIRFGTAMRGQMRNLTLF